MSRLIDGDALSEKMERLAKFDWNKSTSTTWANAYIEISYMVDDAPTVEPRKGKWVKAEQRGCWTYSNAYAECSCCHGEPTYLGWRMNYCPNCGARMSEGEENEKA